VYRVSGLIPANLPEWPDHRNGCCSSLCHPTACYVDHMDNNMSTDGGEIDGADEGSGDGVRRCAAGDHVCDQADFVPGRHSCRRCEAVRHKACTEKLCQLFVDLLGASGCVDCGESDIRFLEGDHILDKKVDLSQYIFMRPAVPSFMAEFLKCEVRCRRCHIRRSLGRIGFWREQLEQEFKATPTEHKADWSGRCLDLAEVPDPGLSAIENRARYAAAFLARGCRCGEARWGLLEFDHEGPRTGAIRNLILYSTMSRLRTELDHCVVRCYACHRLRTNPCWYRARMTPGPLGRWSDQLSDEQIMALRARRLL
jgi:hypothetical protein